jgi:glutathione S-transferase
VQVHERGGAAHHRRVGAGGGSDGHGDTSALPGSYLLGEKFSAADVLYTPMFALFAQSPVMPKSAVIEECVGRVLARPAFGRAQTRDNG